MKKKIQFSLVYRDMWQSSGKFQPRKDQLEPVSYTHLTLPTR